MNPIRQWWQHRQKKNEEERTRYLREEFEVTEKSGIIYLTHNGVAFEQIASDTPSGEIAEMLNAARDTALQYRMP